MAAADAVSSRRAARRALQHEVSRTQVLDAAEEVFGRKGFHEATLREVAQLAEFSVGSLYSFFDGKDELFRQIFIRRGDEFMPALGDLLGDHRADPRRQLHDLVDFQVGFFRQHPHFGRLYLRYAGATALTIDQEIDGILNERHDEAIRQQAALIRRGQEAGAFHPGDPLALGRLFSSLMSAFQALDPAVVADDGEVPERLTLEELHDIVDRTFVRATGSAGRARR